MNFEAIKAELKRELGQGRAVYPKWAKEGTYRWTKEKATAAILDLEDALACVEFTEACVAAGFAFKQSDRLRPIREAATAKLFD